jgi:Ni/Co efflux regulator RcnB
MRLLLITLALALLAGPALAQRNTRGTETVMEQVFSAVERQLINEYFDQDRGGRKAKHKGRGRSKKGRGGGLPPGLAMQLDSRGRLPPGLEGRDLPSGLSSRLGHAGLGRSRQIVGNDVVLIETATGVILDILRGAAGQ